jgi:hypothetical protein
MMSSGKTTPAARRLADHPVAHIMAIAVVDAFEQIDIQHRHADIVAQSADLFEKCRRLDRPDR